jgi:hypothetical protein
MPRISLHELEKGNTGRCGGEYLGKSSTRGLAPTRHLSTIPASISAFSKLRSRYDEVA